MNKKDYKQLNQKERDQIFLLKKMEQEGADSQTHAVLSLQARGELRR